MIVFGGWVPLSCDADSQQAEKEWKCTDSLATLNVRTLTWENISMNTVDGSLFYFNWHYQYVPY